MCWAAVAADVGKRGHVGCPTKRLEVDEQEAIEPRNSIGHLIRTAQQAHSRYWQNEFQGDLTGPQYAVLAAVSRWPGIDQGRAGELASLDKSSTADIVRRLADSRGWLTRTDDPEDSRRRVLKLSVPAALALRYITPKAQAVQQQLLSALEPSQAGEFIRLLGRVAYRSGSDLPPEPAEAEVEVLNISTVPGHLLRRSLQVHTALWTTHVGGELTGPQYAVLATLALHGPMGQKRLGRLASLDKSVAGDVALRLDRKELIAKERDPGDGRQSVLRLTELGRETLSTVRRPVAIIQEELLAPLTVDEGRRLVLMLAAVAELGAPQ